MNIQCPHCLQDSGFIKSEGRLWIQPNKEHIFLSRMCCYACSQPIALMMNVFFNCTKRNSTIECRMIRKYPDYMMFSEKLYANHFGNIGLSEWDDGHFPEKHPDLACICDKESNTITIKNIFAFKPEDFQMHMFSIGVKSVNLAKGILFGSLQDRKAYESKLKLALGNVAHVKLNYWSTYGVMEQIDEHIDKETRDFYNLARGIPVFLVAYKNSLKEKIENKKLAIARETRSLKRYCEALNGLNYKHFDESIVNQIWRI